MKAAIVEAYGLPAFPENSRRSASPAKAPAKRAHHHPNGNRLGKGFFGGSGVVAEVGHDPVSDHAGRHAAANSPDQPRPPAQCVENRREWHLLQHPRTVHPTEPEIFEKLLLDLQYRRPLEFEPAMQLPKG